MELNVAEIFSLSKSSLYVSNAIKAMYGNQNNVARIFQLKKDIAGLQQEGKHFVQHLGNMKSIWDELVVYPTY